LTFARQSAFTIPGRFYRAVIQDCCGSDRSGSAVPGRRSAWRRAAGHTLP